MKLSLMDLMMPQMDGYTACSAIKSDQTTKSIPAIILTAVDNESNKKLAKGVGGEGYINPYNSQDR